MRSLLSSSSTAIACAVIAGLSGCNAFDEPVAGGHREVRVVPTDEREVERAEVTALPVSGGTLLGLSGGRVVAASDPSRDRISLTDGDQVTEIEFADGSQPWRMTQIAASALAVSLRGAGQIVAFDLDQDNAPSERWRADVCTAPRGLDFDLDTGRVHVACAGGELVSLDADSGAELGRLQLDSDLRDVVVNDGRIYVSRFRAAEVLLVDGTAPPNRISLPTVVVRGFSLDEPRTMKPTVAWRMQALVSGGVAVVHQRADVNPVPVDVAQNGERQGGSSSSSPYGGGGRSPTSDCVGIVQTGVSAVGPDGSLRTSDSLSGIVLPVDMAVSADEHTFAIANAGTPDSSAPASTMVPIGDVDSPPTALGVSVPRAVTGFDSGMLHPAQKDSTVEVRCVGGSVLLPGEPSTAVLFNGNTLVVQQPRTSSLLMSTSEGLTHTIELGGPSLRDTGHDIFHRDSGAGISCASCHPEGTDDGHVWVFEGLGPRRTQNLATPLAETAPYHWDGELGNVATLMNEVFVERMGGVFQSEQRMDRLQDWLFTAPQPVAIGQRDEAAKRGQALFESAEVGCSSCHRGDALSDNSSYDVGTSGGAPLQTPSLVGVAAHPPFMHDGCARTLEERFNAECGGGDAHGRTSQLSSEQRADLVSYLRTL